MDVAEQVAVAVEKAAGSPWRLPWHVFTRIAALVGDEPVVHVDARVEPQGREFSGTILVLTRTRVVDATFAGSGDTDRDENARASTVTATTWPRTALERIAIPADPEGETNLDKTWGEDWRDLWPCDAHVELSYGSFGTVRLPLGERPTKANRTALRALLPSLFADLTAR